MRQISIILISFWTLLSCANTSGKPVQKPGVHSLQELLVGAMASKPLEKDFRTHFQSVLPCFTQHLSQQEVVFYLSGGQLQLKKGRLLEFKALSRCVEDKLSEALSSRSLWIWTASSAVPKEVGKNWISIRLDSFPQSIRVKGAQSP